MSRPACVRHGRHGRSSVRSVRAACGLAAFAALASVLPGTSAAQAPGLRDVFESALACRLAEPLLADSVAAPAYARTAGGCAATVPGAGAGSEALYADPGCTEPFSFEPTDLGGWCATLLDPQGIGEGRDIDPAWTLSPGSRLDVGARRLDGVVQPYVRRFVYREVETPRGTCSLEMRVYAPRPVAERNVEGGVGGGVGGGGGGPSEREPGPSLIAWHGGSWSDRGFGFFGLELTVPHFVERGFTVYAPFYRLLGEGDGAGGGSPACSEADFETDIVDDANAALDWVLENDVRFGSDGPPVLFGQSAGGQLAARLAVDRPRDVAGAVLFYAPVDFGDFAARAASGAYTGEQGLGILERVLGVPADAADPSASPIPENSLPERIARDGIAMPPTFLLQGGGDTLVEPRQAVRLCDALAGVPLLPTDVPYEVPAALRTLRDCGPDSTLHLVRRGEHALDVCPVAIPFSDAACPSGGPASRALVADSIGAAASFATVAAGASQDVFFPDDEPGAGDPGSVGTPASGVTDGAGGIAVGDAGPGAGSGGGGGATTLGLLTWLSGIAAWRRSRSSVGGPPGRRVNLPGARRREARGRGPARRAPSRAAS